MESSYTPLYVPVRAARPLRVGLLLDSPLVMGWISRICEEMQVDNVAEVDFVVIAERAPELNVSRANRMLYDGYVRYETSRRRTHASPLQTEDISLTLPKVTRLIVEAELRDGIPTLAAVDLDSIRSRQPDVLLQFGPAFPITGDLLSIPTHGVWTYTYGNIPDSLGESGLFREIHRGDPVSMSELRRLQPDGSAHVLYRSFGSTHPHSLELGKQDAVWKASNFVMRILRRIAGGEPVEALDALPDPGSPCHPPGNLRMMQFLSRIIKRRARALIRNRAGIQHWSVAWRIGGQINPAFPEIEGMSLLESPHGHFYADPFLFHHQGENWLFLEDYDYKAQKADIIAIPWDRDGPAGPARTALRLSAHLSYPCVFEWDGQVYMVPEIGESGGPVRLFRARRFPEAWEFVCELLSGHNAVDATLHEHGGRWYLFANICEAPGGSENDELFLFHADTPLGPFAPHPLNPIVSDVRGARPGGRLYIHQRRLIRPSQDCAADYGRALVFNEVLELGPRHYSERVLGRLEPTERHHFVGCHTYASLGDLEVIDLKHQRFRAAVGA